jgi:periplasmic divalent cation tolerance protein
MDGHALVLITCGDSGEARVVASRLVEERLAAGAQLIPIESIYRWKEDVVEDTEVLVIAKTRRDRFVEIEALVGELHSYEVPPIVMLEMDAASAAYLGWIDGSVRA